MRRGVIRVFAALVLLSAAGTGAARAIEAVAARAQGVDLATMRIGSLARDARSDARRLPVRADLLGATWRGTADAIELRAQGSDGRWSRWVELHAAEDGPDPASREARGAARRVGARRTAAAPLWVGDAERVQVRSHDGTPARDIEIVAINATGTATRSERAAGTLRRSAAWVLGSDAEAMPAPPGIRSRATWGALPPRNEPAMADETGVLGAVVHHTAGTNRYTCKQVPALLRGIQRYHMQTQGWNDIGYNFLVDACGGVWEGRGGGTTRPVIGAHTSGFNTATTGIALIGTHAAVRPTAKARLALQRLLAWRLDVAHVKPNAKMALTARTSDKFSAGSRVVVRAVSGHRDLFPTSCPGALGYRELHALAGAAWRTGGVKVANIARRYELAHPDDPLDPSVGRVDVRAIGSASDMYLTLRIERSSTGEVLHEHAVTGSVISTTWTPPAELRLPAWDLRIAVNGATSTQRARGALVPLLAVPTDPGFTVTTPPAATVVPGGDPVDDQLRLQYVLGADYRMGAWLHDPATGEEVAQLLEPEYVGVTGDVPRELLLSIPAKVAAGTYELRVGLPADPAVGRSIERFPVTVQRP